MRGPSLLAEPGRSLVDGFLARPFGFMTCRLVSGSAGDSVRGERTTAEGLRW